MNKLSAKLLQSQAPAFRTVSISSAHALSRTHQMVLLAQPQMSVFGLMGVVPQRGWLPYYLKKYEQWTKPTYFDNINRTPQKRGQVKLRTADPLWLDEE